MGPCSPEDAAISPPAALGESETAAGREGRKTRARDGVGGHCLCARDPGG